MHDVRSKLKGKFTQNYTSSTHCERLSLAATSNKAEALRLNGHSCALDVLLHIPETKLQQTLTSTLSGIHVHTHNDKWTMGHNYNDFEAKGSIGDSKYQ